ncbi:hypothetical protein [Streptomyces brasiliensis]|uniref:C2H2-type domain-containing protein n=1 Tax=Streptomyces brasiliensis TaxID=1954 RepID=A0A917KQU9_9ACTN|nr:hypothetical protein [Streptomyces brasiliensis]GGJ23741.1 hypothetical protein GCM10010121_038360 [Streptomyces brasiliensis]
MSEIAGQTGLRGTATAVVHESYSFACMRCGHGWEQSYDIEHHTDTDGNEYVMYVADGRFVPSPLSRPTCRNCDGHVVRIMRPGQVSSVRSASRRHERRTDTSGTPEAATQAGEQHHWHLSDLLHPFQRKAS